MDIHFKKLLLPILALFAMTAHAQSLSGLVTDEETGQPLEAVMISVLRNGTMIDYALTDARGRYSLPWKYNGNLQVSVSLLGYRREIRNISAAGTLHIRLHPEAIALKEVQIRPGRIHGRKDTVRYNLAEFASSKDVHIKDVLKKLPGVDIDDNGQVKYKGKAIDHYFVEGMDVTGGRYSQINNNLSAKAVKSAEIMENYQSVKALKGKLSSDEIALNLKLDPQARDQWIVNGTLGAGWSDGTQETTGTAQTKRDKGTLLWENAANALQLGKGKQSIYGYKSNNNGTDLSREQHILTNNTSQQIPLHGFLVQPGISAPLDKQRLLFNETHTLNANRMYKWNDERSLRLQADIPITGLLSNGATRKSTTSPMTPYAWMKPTTTACRTMPPIWKCTMRITRPSTICRTASWQKVKRTAAPPTSCSKRCAPPSLRQRISSALSVMERNTHGSSILPHSMPIYPPPCHYTTGKTNSSSTAFTTTIRPAT